MTDRDADIQSVPGGEAPYQPPTQEPRAAEHHNRGHGIPPPPSWAHSPHRGDEPARSVFGVAEAALRKRDVPRSVQDFLSNGRNGRLRSYGPADFLLLRPL